MALKHLQTIIVATIMMFSLIVNAQDIYKKNAKLMGVDFQFAVVANSKKEGEYFLQVAIDEVKRVEALISSWNDNSQTSLINKNGGKKAVKVDIELFNLIKRSKHISKLTDGHFDISFASIDKIWYFHKPLVTVPDSITIKKSIQYINYKNIIIDDKTQTVFLKNEGMKIGFGAIGKGYVAEKVKEKLKSIGVTAGLINASGDISCWGDHPITKTWKVAITNPDKTKNDLASFDLYDSSVVTSGNYENYVTINNKHYSHIINPKTGWPCQGIKSVTVFSKNAELADALSTTVFVMGKDKGLNLINQLKNIECLIVDDNNNMHYSKSLKTKFN